MRERAKSKPPYLVWRKILKRRPQALRRQKMPEREATNPVNIFENESIFAYLRVRCLLLRHDNHRGKSPAYVCMNFLNITVHISHAAIKTLAGIKQQVAYIPQAFSSLFVVQQRTRPCDAPLALWLPAGNQEHQHRFQGVSAGRRRPVRSLLRRRPQWLPPGGAGGRNAER